MPPTEDATFGFECESWYTLTPAWTGSGGAVTWTKLNKVGKDVKYAANFDKGDFSSRDYASKQYRAGMSDVSVTFQMVRDRTDATYLAMETAAMARTPVEFYFGDKKGSTPAAGTSGLRGVYVLTKMEQSEPLTEASVVDFEATPLFGWPAPGIFTQT